MFFSIEKANESFVFFKTVKFIMILFSFYTILKLKLKLKPAMKNGTEVTLNPSSNLIGSSNYETNFPNKLLLTNT